jgi:predicted phage terminase large subunit-like protein
MKKKEELKINSDIDIAKLRDKLSNGDLSQDEQNRIWQYLVREKVSKSIYALCHHLLKIRVSPSQKELCDFVQDESGKRKLVLWPRGHGKTSICTVAKSIHILMNNPEAKILILSATDTIAKDILRQIKHYFLYDEKFKFAFPELCPSDEKDFGTQDYFDVPCKKVISKEHSIEAGSFEANFTGKHFTHIIKDDLVIRENSETKDLCEKTIRINQLTYPLMETDAFELVIGTRYSYADMYGALIDAGFHQTSIKSVTKEDGSALCPEFFGPEKVSQAKRDCSSPYIYSCQYENSPVDPDTAVFKVDKIKKIKRDDLPVLNVFTMVDPAISEKSSADYSSIVTAGVDKDWNIYVLDIFRKRVNPSEIIEAIIEIYKRFKPFYVGVESVQYQKAISFFLRQKCKEENIHIPVKELTRDTRVSKYQRISGLSPKVEYEELFIVDECRNKEFLIEEMKRYPKTPHDDCIDALADILRMGFKLGAGEENRKIPTMKQGIYWDRIVEAMEEMPDVLGNQGLRPWDINLAEVLHFNAA